MSFDTYRQQTRSLSDDLTVVRDGWVAGGYSLTAGRVAMFGYGKYKNYTDGASDALTYGNLALSGLNFFLPLKTPIIALQRSLKAAEAPVGRIDDQLDRLDGIAWKTTPRNLNFIEGINRTLDRAEEVHAAVRDTLTTTIFALETSEEATENQSSALTAALAVTADDATDPSEGASDYAVLRRLLDAQAEPRVEAVETVRPAVASVRQKVDDFNEMI